MFDKILGRREPAESPESTNPTEGDRYDGPAAYCADYGIVSRPGYYALSEDGREVDAGLRLVYVDDARGDDIEG